MIKYGDFATDHIATMGGTVKDGRLMAHINQPKGQKEEKEMERVYTMEEINQVVELILRGAGVRRDRLLPCPHCGGDVEMRYLEERHYMVRCEDCGAVMLYRAHSTTDAEVIWNRRAETQQRPADGRDAEGWNEKDEYYYRRGIAKMLKERDTGEKKPSGWVDKIMAKAIDEIMTDAIQHAGSSGSTEYAEMLGKEILSVATAYTDKKVAAIRALCARSGAETQQRPADGQDAEGWNEGVVFGHYARLRGMEAEVRKAIQEKGLTEKLDGIGRGSGRWPAEAEPAPYSAMHKQWERNLENRRVSTGRYPQPLTRRSNQQDSHGESDS